MAAESFGPRKDLPGEALVVGHTGRSHQSRVRREARYYRIVRQVRHSVNGPRVGEDADPQVLDPPTEAIGRRSRGDGTGHLLWLARIAVMSRSQPSAKSPSSRMST